MNYIICCVENYDNIIDKESLEKLDNLENYDIHLFTNCAYNKVMPYDILYALDTIKKFKEDNFIFVSTIKPLFDCVYRIYHQSFDKFVFWNCENIEEYKLKNIFAYLENIKICDNDMLYKKVYNNLSDIISQDNEFIQKEIYQKYYYINNKYYLFEPTNSDKIVIIGSDNLDLENIEYAYFYNRQLDSIIENIENMDKNNKFNMKDIHIFETNIKNINLIEKNLIIRILENYSCKSNLSIEKKILIYSLLNDLNCNSKYVLQIQNIVLKSMKGYANTAYFIWNRIKRLVLLNNKLSDIEIQINQKLIYKNIIDDYKSILEEYLVPMKKEERNKNVIIVFTIQLLDNDHAPTHTTLERIYTLGKLLGKKVILINTKEQYSLNGAIPFCNTKIANIKPEFSKKHSMEYKGFKFGFYQPEVEMPDINEIFSIINFIKEKKPYYIMSIGTGSITADLCGMIVPQMSLALAFSTLPTTTATFSIIGKRLNQVEWEKYISNGYNHYNLIESKFTFDLKKQHTYFTKEQFNIPENKFILIVVGIRLDSEIDKQFINTMLKTIKYNTHIVFAGKFDKYKEYCYNNIEFTKNSTYIYACNDMLALMELCDLYINPKRLGGGFSVIEAFSKGVPAVTINTGDVAVAAGEEFCVSDYDEMLETVKRYIKDKDFYNEMSKKAKERAELMTDSKSAMEEIIDKIENSPIFW